MFHMPMENLTTDLHQSDDASAAASSSTASSSGSTSWPLFDVFINHRGLDVKTTLARDLYRRLSDCGLRVFLDKYEMEKGHSITSQIEQAIRSASVHVAIFSPRYAESRWCLDELVLMEESGATILPVFFKVDPSVLRWTQNGGAYAKALRNHQQKKICDSQTGEEKPRFTSDTIQKWRNALSHVADLSGFVHQDEDEVKLSHEIVQIVLKKVPKTQFEVAKYPTGLDIKLKEFEKAVLSQQQETELMEAKVVCIVGVGGVGKTTLAKYFFNLRRSGFNSSSFLFDVRETARKMSLPYLQSKLLRDLKPEAKADNKIDSREEGVEILKKHLSYCHALIVLDDVDHMDQLEAVLPIKKILRSNSLIVITSRDKHVLRASRVLEASIYNLKGMSTPHSKDLFCRYAFDQSDPLPELADLVDRFVKECAGLPLSLKVFGALVCTQNERPFWQEILENLENPHRILPNGIHDRLRISYDSLEPKVKEIFLDIACFFLGEDVEKAIRIWGIVGVRNLLDRCLLEVDSEYKIKMHDHLRDLGREIAKEGSLPRRLWHDDLFQQSSPGRTPVWGIKMVSSSRDPFRRDNTTWSRVSGSSEMKHLFSNFGSSFDIRNLRLLATEEDHLEDALRRVQPHLSWFRWCECSHSSLPDWIPMKVLRVLEIQGPRLNRLWPHQSQAVPLQLRELNICAPLLHIPKCIGQLKNLERIAIWNSRPGETITVESTSKWFFEALKIQRLPDEFCHLPSLKYLVLKKFSKIVSLPDSFGNLTNLQYIDLAGASNLQMLPNSFRNLTRLQHLSLEECSMLTISRETLGNITTLQYLNLSGCKQLKELPPQVAQQRSLQTLNLVQTNLKELPSDIGNLCNLEYQRLGEAWWAALPRGYLLEKLPRHLCDFNTLKSLSSGSYLGLDTASWEALPGGYLLDVLPRGLGDLKSLKSLYLADLLQLKCLPDSIEQLTQLTSLEIQSCGIKYLPQELLKMNNLEMLSVADCPLGELPFKREVERIRETPLSLEGEKALNYGCMFGLKQFYLKGTKTREVFFDEGVCPNLQLLFISKCSELRQIGGLGQLTKLQLLSIRECSELRQIVGLGQLTKLQKLDIELCREIRALKGVEHLTYLEKLRVATCEKLQSIQGLGQLTELRTLIVRDCREIQELPGLEHLTSLKILFVSNFKKLQSIQGSGQLTNLGRLYIAEGPERQGLPGMEHLNSLEMLNFPSCEKLQLQSIQGLGQLTKLQELYIIQCPEIQALEGMEHLTSLRELNVSGCKKLQSIQGLGQLTNLQVLSIVECPEIQALPGMEHLTSLEMLDFSSCQKLRSIQGLGQLTKLNYLCIKQCPEIPALPDMEHLTSLVTLEVCGCEKLESIQPVGQLTKLVALNVQDCCEIQALPGMEHLTSLKTLDVSGCEKLESIQQVGQLTQLTALNVQACCEIQELPGLKHLTSLGKLNAGGCEKLKCVQWLGQLTQLTELNVQDCREIQELPGLEHLISLEKLNARGCKKLKSLQGLGQLTELTELNVQDCREIQELPGLEHLTSLGKLNAGGCEKLKSVQGLGYLTELTELNIQDCREIQELPGLEALTFSGKLNAGGCEKLKSVQGLGKLTELTELNVQNCREIQELPGLEHLTYLEKLNAGGCVKIKSVQGLGQLTKLRELDVSKSHEIPAMPGLEHLTCLRKLNVSGLAKLKSIQGLEQLTEIRELDVSECYEIPELPVLEHLTSLETLNVGRLGKLKNIRGLGQLTQLRELDVSGCSELGELPGVEYLRSLQILNACECPNLQLREGVLEQLHQQLKDGFKFDEQKGCLQFLQCCLQFLQFMRPDS